MAYYVYVNIFQPIYFPKVDPTKPIEENELAEDSNFTLELFSYNSKTYQKNLLLSQSFIYNTTPPQGLEKDIEFPHGQNLTHEKLLATISFQNRMNQKSTVQCAVDILENKNERFFDLQAEVNDVISKDSIGEIKPHLKSKIYINFLFDNSQYQSDHFLYNMFYNYNRKSKQFYSPQIDCLQIWVQERDKVPLYKLEGKPKSVAFSFSVYPIKKFIWWMKIYLTEKQVSSLMYDAKSFEDIKSLFLDNSFGYLVVFFTVNILHSIFQLFSMKNTISFFRNNDVSRGLSHNQYFLDFFYQLIILLYLIDNDSSLLIIFFTFLELLLSFWIALKFLKFEPREDKKFPFYQLVQPKDEISLETRKYEQEITGWLYKILVPILAIFCSYKFLTRNRLSLYSWILKTLVGFIYLIGFINMTPQVYINYKLKSVEYLPWNAMIYKFLNTIIDDLFAFAIKIPMIQRLSVFRDDIIFLIYLYQLWIYRKKAKRKEE